MTKIKLALCQMQVRENKEENLRKAVDMLTLAASQGAQIAVLPEMFTCPYENSKFSSYAEEEATGQTIETIAKTARSTKMQIIGGSIPEREDGKLYNTSFVFDSYGNVIAKHRKIHLFDIDIPGKIRFKESETLTAGNTITVVSTECCKVGVAICYDIRFPELMHIMAHRGAQILVLPAAFNMVTGPAHWELLMRARAVDHQIFVAAVSPARDEHAPYIAYGNSLVADPWGRIILQAGEKEELLITEIDLTEIDKVREKLPVINHRRTDLYEIWEK